MRKTMAAGSAHHIKKLALTGVIAALIFAPSTKGVY
jgi:hypothetical protein